MKNELYSKMKLCDKMKNKKLKCQFFVAIIIIIIVMFVVIIIVIEHCQKGTAQANRISLISLNTTNILHTCVTYDISKQITYQIARQLTACTNGYVLLFVCIYTYILVNIFK